MDEVAQAQGSRRGPIAAIIGAVLAAGAVIVAAAAARRRKRAGTTVELSIEIDRPADEVFAFVSDARNDPQWLSGAVERHKLTDGPIGVGTRIESTDGLGPRTITMIEEVTEYVPGHRVRTTVSGAWSGTYEMQVEPDGGGTVLRLRAQLHGSGLVGLFDVLPDRLIQRGFERESRNLKDLLERRAETLTAADDASEPYGQEEVAAIRVEAEAGVTT